MSPGGHYRQASAFTVPLETSPKVAQKARRPLDRKPLPGDPSFDVAVVEIDDDGPLVRAAQLSRALRRIRRVRERHDLSGALVVLFIHGWHHGAAWDDPHFESFRDILAFLAIREYERGTHARRVIGIYVGWDGEPKGTSLYSGLKFVPGLTHATFWNRYEAALEIGEGNGIREVLLGLTRQVKGKGGRTSQLILLGHSMGGLILESALLNLVRGPGAEMLRRCKGDPATPARTATSRYSVLFPDAVISLNSAADSWVAETLVGILVDKGINRVVSGDRHLRRSAQRLRGIEYAAPLLISVTASEDTDTGRLWPLAMGALRKARRLPGVRRLERKAARAKGKRATIRDFKRQERLATIGHQSTLHTHLLKSGGKCKCAPKEIFRPGHGIAHPVPDLGQNFHCLREPVPLKSTTCKTPMIPVDLPTSDRRKPGDPGKHKRYRLVPRKGRSGPQLLWNFQVPKELIPDHNEIFNTRASSLILALMQISGAVASLAEDWESSFER